VGGLLSNGESYPVSEKFTYFYDYRNMFIRPYPSGGIPNIIVIVIIIPVGINAKPHRTKANISSFLSLLFLDLVKIGTAKTGEAMNDKEITKFKTMLFIKKRFT
jgi:hypothetical protein